jgi:hypothetical protein
MSNPAITLSPLLAWQNTGKFKMPLQIFIILKEHPVNILSGET